jgi:putative holliday junction resolvase
MRIIGLDVGDKRIGVAISDESGIVSVPLKVIGNDKNSGEEIKKIIDKYNVGKIVVGVPYTLKGEIGIQAKKVIKFTNDTIKNLGPDVDYFDERYTTKIPSGHLKNHSAGSNIDKISASIILGDYLEKERKRN